MSCSNNDYIISLHCRNSRGRVYPRFYKLVIKYTIARELDITFWGCIRVSFSFDNSAIDTISIAKSAEY